MDNLQVLGAGAFGVVLGWYVYYVNRFRKGDVQLTDIVTLLGAIGGGTVLTLFDKKTDLFGAYGLGLAIGFFGYLIVLAFLVKGSPNFNGDWFLDGRRKDPESGWGYPGGGAGPEQKPMLRNPDKHDPAGT